MKNNKRYITISEEEYNKEQEIIDNVREEFLKLYELCKDDNKIIVAFHDDGFNYTLGEIHYPKIYDGEEHIEKLFGHKFSFMEQRIEYLEKKLNNIDDKKLFKLFGLQISKI